MDLIQQNTEAAIQDLQASWNKSVQAILETAQMLIQYQQRADWFQIKDELARRNIMESSVLSMMMSIGRNSLLNDVQYLHQLPSSYNGLYHLTKMPDAELKEALDNKQVTQASRIEDIKRLRNANNAKPKAAKNVIKKLIMSEDDYKEHKQEIQKLLSEISNEHGYITIK